MDKESIFELQKIDCNCSDCIFMIRNLDRHKQSVEQHHKWQLDYFEIIKNNLLKKADEWKDKGELDKYDNLVKEANKMKFQFNRNTAMINYGRCNKLDKDVTFIPNTCQLETQKCFKHRRE